MGVRWDKENTVMISLRLMKKIDADILKGLKTSQVDKAI